MSIKKFSIIMFLIPIMVLAQVEWQDGGVPVGFGENIYWEGNSSVNTLGFTVFVWSDCRSGQREVYAQKVDCSGQIYWGDSGIQISSGYVTNFKPIIESSIDGTVIILWEANSLYENSILLAQKVNNEGELCWPSNGVIIPSENGSYFKDLLTTNDGKVYIGSCDYDYIRVTLLNSDGNVDDNWQTNQTVTGNVHLYDMLEDGEGGIYLSYKQNSSSLKVNRLDQYGNSVWGDDGFLICESGLDYNSLIAKDQGSNLICAYSSYITDNQYENIIMKITNTGEIDWEIQLPSDESFREICNLVISNTNEIYLGILNYEATGSDYVIRKYTENGDLHWGENGVNICEVENGWVFNNIDMSVSTDNDVCIKWEAKNGPSETKIIVQRLTEDGTTLYTNNGLVLEHSSFSTPQSIALHNESFYQVIWLNKTNQGDELKTQFIDSYGNMLLQESEQIMMESKSIAVNEYVHTMKSNKSYIFWSGSGHNGNIAFQVVDEFGNLEQPISGSTFSTGNHYQSNLNVEPGFNEDLMVVSWRAESSGIDCKKSYTKAIDLQGNCAWNNTEIFLGENAYNNYSTITESYDNNGIDEYYYAIPTLDEIQNELIIKVHKIVDGEKQWGENGITIDGPGNSRPVAFNGRFLIWRSWQNGNHYLRLSKLSNNGVIEDGWPVNGVPISDFYTKKIKLTNLNNGVLISWLDYINDSYILKLKLIDEDGVEIWASSEFNITQESNDFEYDLVVYEDGIYITWINYINMPFKILLQKLSHNGNTLWEEPHTIFEADYPFLTDLELVNYDSKLIMCWGYASNSYGLSYDLYGQILDGDGEVLLQPSGHVLTTYHNYGFNSKINFDDTGVYISWLDGSLPVYNYDPPFFSSNSIYMQKFDLSCVDNDNEVIAKPNVIFSNHPNPFNPTTTISFELNTENAENTEDTEIEIFNVKGQRIVTLSAPIESECIEGRRAGSITWNGTDQNNKKVSSGIYYYTLILDGKVEASRKMVLLK